LVLLGPTLVLPFGRVAPKPEGVEILAGVIARAVP